MFSDRIQQKEKQIILLCIYVIGSLRQKLRCCLFLPNLATLEPHRSSTEKPIPLVACAHEIAQIAARLAEEDRDRKNKDDLVRRHHAKDGKLKIKNRLMVPPTFDEEFC
jgi:hypothetical protein